jgi:nucleotidyltransferase substrate binding protein (TIGR01987 family)
MPHSEIVRDAAIQRFEYSFELVWKLLMEYLRVAEGIICNSPKACWREAFKTGLLGDDDTTRFLEMTDDRNQTVHTYREEIAEVIFGRLKAYHLLMERLVRNIRKRT